jgi:hypothetical protein
MGVIHLNLHKKEDEKKEKEKEKPLPPLLSDLELDLLLSVLWHHVDAPLQHQGCP